MRNHVRFEVMHPLLVMSPIFERIEGTIQVLIWCDQNMDVLRLTLICFRWMPFRYKDEPQDTLRESISIILSLVINPNLTSYLRFQDGEL